MDKVYRKSSVYLIISTEASNDVTGFRDKQKVVHALQGHVADAVTATVSALGLARVVRTVLRTAFNLRGGKETTTGAFTIWHCATKWFSCRMELVWNFYFGSKFLAVLRSFLANSNLSFVQFDDSDVVVDSNLDFSEIEHTKNTRGEYILVDSFILLILLM